MSWGESLFIANGISSAQSPLDLTKANIPGTELKDIFEGATFKIAEGVAAEGKNADAAVKFMAFYEEFHDLCCEAFPSLHDEGLAWRAELLGDVSHLPPEMRSDS